MGRSISGGSSSSSGTSSATLGSLVELVDGSNEYNGYLKCNGQTISVSKYPDLAKFLDYDKSHSNFSTPTNTTNKISPCGTFITVVVHNGEFFLFTGGNKIVFVSKSSDGVVWTFPKMLPFDVNYGLSAISTPNGIITVCGRMALALQSDLTYTILRNAANHPNGYTPLYSLLTTNGSYYVFWDDEVRKLYKTYDFVTIEESVEFETARGVTDTASPRGATYFNGSFYIASLSNKIYKSSDLVNFQVINMNQTLISTTGNALQVCNGKLFVTLGATGYSMAYSDDGETFTYVIPQATTKSKYCSVMFDGTNYFFSQYDTTGAVWSTPDLNAATWSKYVIGGFSTTNVYASVCSYTNGTNYLFIDFVSGAMYSTTTQLRADVAKEIIEPAMTAMIVITDSYMVGALAFTSPAAATYHYLYIKDEATGNMILQRIATTYTYFTALTTLVFIHYAKLSKYIYLLPNTTASTAIQMYNVAATTRKLTDLVPTPLTSTIAVPTTYNVFHDKGVVLVNTAGLTSFFVGGALATLTSTKAADATYNLLTGEFFVPSSTAPAYSRSTNYGSTWETIAAPAVFNTAGVESAAVAVYPYMLNNNYYSSGGRHKGIDAYTFQEQVNLSKLTAIGALVIGDNLVIGEDGQLAYIDCGSVKVGHKPTVSITTHPRTWMPSNDVLICQYYSAVGKSGIGTYRKFTPITKFNVPYINGTVAGRTPYIKATK